MDRLVSTRAQSRANMIYQANSKSVGLSYLLWFFLGGLGVHRFYLGRNGSAIAQLLLGLLGWIPLLTGWIVLVIWVLVDAILIPGIAREENERLANQLVNQIR
ncbi:MAG: TM2 domain-containing protein [Sphingomonadaceae bacterium]|nr:TM2 domain-containing protein [Sphingomonadaceae bacterium]